MLAWTNFAILIFAILFLLYFYVLSVSPAALEMVTGVDAYKRCGWYRLVAMIFEFITIANFVVYRFYPLPTPLPESFPWPYWVSFLIAVLIGVPTVTLMVVGMFHAGKETAIPDKSHSMYNGIYKIIRHPQAAGEVFGWMWMGFLLNSPFLVLFSLVFFPVFLIMCAAEEHDLLLRFGDSYAKYMRTTGAFFPMRK